MYQKLLTKLKDCTFRFFAPALRLVGLAGLLGFHYPVRYYRSEVCDRLWRGSRLRYGDAEILDGYGVRTVINLCYEKTPLDEEPECRRVGLQYVNIQVADNAAPSVAQLEYFCKLVDDDKVSPVYVHCEAGIGRTGTFVAAYRITNGWTVAEAIKESTRYGHILPCQEKTLRWFATYKFYN